MNVILTKMMFLLCCQTALTNLCMFNIKEQLQTVYDLKTMTENVCAGAKKKFSEIPKDDITVAAARVVLRSGN